MRHERNARLSPDGHDTYADLPTHFSIFPHGYRTEIVVPAVRW